MVPRPHVKTTIALDASRVSFCRRTESARDQRSIGGKLAQGTGLAVSWSGIKDLCAPRSRWIEGRSRRIVDGLSTIDPRISAAQDESP
jgi:hypothetical protein